MFLQCYVRGLVIAEYFLLKSNSIAINILVVYVILVLAWTGTGLLKAGPDQDRTTSVLDRTTPWWSGLHLG